MKYFLHLSYCGKNYRGWQRQPRHISVQETLEDRLSSLFSTQTKVSCCGRTDALVHAAQFFGHIKTGLELNKTHVQILNKMLPGDIVVHDIIPVEKNAHAQRDVLSRRYDYFMHFYPDPFISDLSSYYDYTDPDLPLMLEAAEIIRGVRDFRNLCRTPDKHSSTICKISRLDVLPSCDKLKIKISITSNRFLKSMVRLIVGRLLQVASGSLNLDDLKLAIGGNKDIPHLLAYPQGLYLSKVEYPYLNIDPVSSFYKGMNAGFSTA